MNGESRNFIEVYRDAVSPSLCRELVSRFEAASKVRGVVGDQQVHIELKDGWDLAISEDPEWRSYEEALNRAALSCLSEYARTYPQVLLSPVMLRIPAAGGGLRTMQASDLRQLSASELSALLKTPTFGHKYIATSWIMFRDLHAPR